MVESPEDWIAYEAAGRLIDGPSGWDFDHVNRKRPRAEALLNFASQGEVRTRADKWTICKDGALTIDASEQDRTAFLQILFYRIKVRKDKFDLKFSHAPDISVIFDVSDDVNGHYEVTSFELSYGGTKLSPHSHKVTALRFSVTDIRLLFHLAKAAPLTTESPQVSKGGRPAVADWEKAAIEMARRFYVGDLKPQRIVDVENQLAEWLAEQNVYPSPTTLREHAKRYFDAFIVW